jgi:hypothetical protein
MRYRSQLTYGVTVDLRRHCCRLDTPLRRTPTATPAAAAAAYIPYGNATSFEGTRYVSQHTPQLPLPRLLLLTFPYGGQHREWC